MGEVKTLHVAEVFKEIKKRINAGDLIWTAYSLSRLNDRLTPLGIQKDDIKKAITNNGEIIRFEWQHGYEPRILVLIRIKSQTATYIKGIPVHVSIENSEKPIIITLYNDLYMFKNDHKTRKREYYSR